METTAVCWGVSERGEPARHPQRGSTYKCLLPLYFRPCRGKSPLCAASRPILGLVCVCVCVCKLLLHPAVWFSLKSVNFLSKRKQVHMKDLFLQACHRVGVMAGGVAFAQQRLFLARKGAGTELPAEAGSAGSRAAGSITFPGQAGVSTHTCLCTCACTYTCMLSLWLLGC